MHMFLPFLSSQDMLDVAASFIGGKDDILAKAKSFNFEESQLAINFALTPDDRVLDAYATEVLNQGRKVQRPGFEVVQEEHEVWDRQNTTKLTKVVTRATVLL